MGTCRLNVTAADNELAFKFSEALKKQGVTCEQMDVGYGVYNFTGRECPKVADTTCRRGAGDGVVEPAEILEYVLNRYEKYQGLIKEIEHRGVPWVLDDLDPATTFDQEIRARVMRAIGELRRILRQQGVKAGTEAYKEKMALGLYFLAAARHAESVKPGPPFDQFTAELTKAGLGAFKKYLEKHGGLFPDASDDNEYSALDAIRLRKGECTEVSKILYAVMKMAGLTPVFVYVEREGMDRRFLERNPEAMGPGDHHACIGLRLRGRLRLFDAAAIFSDARHNPAYPLTLRQFLAMDYNNFAIAVKKQGYADASTLVLTAAIRFLDPQNPWLYHNRAQNYLRADDFEKAIADFNRAVALHPDSPIMFYSRSDAWKEKGEIEKAFADVAEALKRDPKFAEAYVYRCDLWEKKGELDRALADAEEAIRLKPSLAEAYRWRGICREAKGDLDAAIADYAEAIRRNPKSGEPHLNRGLASIKKREVDAALVDFTEAIHKDPALVAAYLARAFLWQVAKKDTDKAMADISRAFAIAPNNAETWFTRANVWMEKGDLPKAVADYEKALKRKPALARHVLPLRGEALLRMGEVERALPDLTAAIKLHPRDAGLYVLRSEAWEKKGEIDRAIEDCSESLRLKPDQLSMQFRKQRLLLVKQRRDSQAGARPRK